MKTLISFRPLPLWAAIAVTSASFGLAACNDPADDATEQQADAVERASEAAAERIEDQADTMTGAAEDTMENKAEAVEQAGEAKADALEDHADKVEDKTVY
jgi:hypothetical protein